MKLTVKHNWPVLFVACGSAVNGCGMLSTEGRLQMHHVAQVVNGITVGEKTHIILVSAPTKCCDDSAKIIRHALLGEFAKGDVRHERWNELACVNGDVPCTCQTFTTKFYARLKNELRQRLFVVVAEPKAINEVAYLFGVKYCGAAEEKTYDLVPGGMVQFIFP